MSANQILVVDDEVGIRELLFEILRDEGTACVSRRTPRPPAPRARKCAPTSCSRHLDARHRRHHAPQGMGRQRASHHAGGDDVGHGTIDSAVEATRIGAFDFLEKPISLPKLLATVGKALAGGRVLPKTGLPW
jgi:DNA-binding NtrC family response regulator